MLSAAPKVRSGAPQSNTTPSSGTCSDVYTPPTEIPRTVNGPAVTVVSTDPRITGNSSCHTNPQDPRRPSATMPRDVRVRGPGRRRGPVLDLDRSAGATPGVGLHHLLDQV